MKRINKKYKNRNIAQGVIPQLEHLGYASLVQRANALITKCQHNPVMRSLTSATRF
jgi:hypothetical protein